MSVIAYVLINFPALSETFILTEMRAMIRRGHTIVPFTLGPLAGARQPDSGDLEAASRPVSHLSWQDGLSLGPRAVQGMAESLRFVRTQTLSPKRSLLWNAAKIAGAARALSCTHIHAHFAQGAAAHALTAAKLLGVPGSFTAHGHDVYQYPQDLAAKVAAASFSVAVCEDMRHDLAALAPDATVAMVPCGIDATRFMPRTHGSDNQRLLFIGRLIPCKGVDDLLWALAELPVSGRPGLDIVGDGTERATLQNYATDLGLGEHVRFLGAQSSAWIAEHGPSYRAFVAPFRPDATGLKDTGPLVVKEAMGMGLPILTTAQMGMKETVDPTCGFLAEPGNRRDLHAHLARLVALDADARAALGRGARARVLAHYTDDRQAERLSALIEAAAPPKTGMRV